MELSGLKDQSEKVENEKNDGELDTDEEKYAQELFRKIAKNKRERDD